MISKSKTKDKLPRLGKRELICLLLFTCDYVVSVRRSFLFLLVLGTGCVILLWLSLSIPYNCFYEHKTIILNCESLSMYGQSASVPVDL